MTQENQYIYNVYYHNGSTINAGIVSAIQHVHGNKCCQHYTHVRCCFVAVRGRVESLHALNAGAATRTSVEAQSCALRAHR